MSKYIAMALDKEIRKAKREIEKRAGFKITHNQAQKIIAGILKGKSVIIKQKKKGVKIE